MRLLPPERPEGSSGAAPSPAPAPREGAGRGARVWLFRHGTVDAGDSAYGNLDVPLSGTGIVETQRLAEEVGELRPQRVIASPLARARALGAAIAAASDVPLEIDLRWRELDRGAWQGAAVAEYMRRWEAEAEAYWRDPMGWRGHGGESEHELRERAFAALFAAVDDERLGSDAIVVVAAHGQVIRAAVAAALGLPAVESHALRLDACCGVLLVDEPEGWTIARTNIAHPRAGYVAAPSDGPPEDVFGRAH